MGSKILVRHSGNGAGILADLRWTAPAAGVYNIVADMYCVNTQWNNTNSMIVKNLNFGTKIAEGTTNGFYSDPGALTFNYSGALSLQAGDTLDFASDGRSTGNGNNVAYQVTITSTPEPGTLALLITGGIGLLAYAWRKRR